MLQSLPIGRWWGIPVFLHWSLLIPLVLFCALPGLGISAFFIVFGSILLHEFGHVWCARREGIGTEAVYLSFLGGLAGLSREPQPVREELIVTAGGPAVNLFLWAGFVFGQKDSGCYGGHCKAGSYSCKSCISSPETASLACKCLRLHGDVVLSDWHTYRNKCKVVILKQRSLCRILALNSSQAP